MSRFFVVVFCFFVIMFSERKKKLLVVPFSSVKRQIPSFLENMKLFTCYYIAKFESLWLTDCEQVPRPDGTEARQSWTEGDAVCGRMGHGQRAVHVSHYIALERRKKCLPQERGSTAAGEKGLQQQRGPCGGAEWPGKVGGWGGGGVLIPIDLVNDWMFTSFGRRHS